MPLPTDPVPFIISIIRDFVRENGMDLTVQPIFEQGWALSAKEDQSPLDISINRSELAFLLCGLMRRYESPSFISFGLNYLLGMGEVGELAAVTYIRYSPIKRNNLTAILGALPGHTQLLLINRYMANPRNPIPWFRDWCYERLVILQGEDPEEVLLFLERLEELSSSLSLPLQRELLRSRFGIWLDQLLKMKLSVDQIRYMGKATKPLCSHTISANFLRFLPDADNQTAVQLIKQLACCIRPRHERTEKILRKKLAVDSPELQLTSLEALFTIQCPSRAKTLHYLYLKSPPLRRELYLHLFDLSGHEFYLFMRSLSQAERRNILHYMVDVLCLYDKQWLLDTLDSFMLQHDMNNDRVVKAFDSLRSHVNASDDLQPKPRYVASPPDPDAVAASAQPGGLIGSLQKAIDAISTIASSKDSISPAVQADIDYLQGLKHGKFVQKKTFRSLRIPHGKYEKVVFDTVTFGAMDFSNSFFYNCTFDGCSFDLCDFEVSLFDSCIFHNCHINDCRFSFSKFNSCKTSQTSFKNSSFYNAVLASCQFRTTDFHCISFIGSLFKSTQIICSQITYSFFNYSCLQNCHLNGLDIEQTLFSDSYITNLTARNTSTLCCLFTHTSVFHQQTDNHDFIDLERHSTIENLKDLAPEIQPTAFSPNLDTSEGLKLIFQVMERWFHHKDTNACLARFMENNHRKLEWSWQMLQLSGGFFLKMLPALVESPILKKDNRQTVKAPRCKITGYTPDFPTKDFIETRISPDVFKPAKDNEEPPIPIEALYTIGSIGSIAQSHGSDIDLWICYDRKRLSPPQVLDLRKKLRIIEQWADSNLKLEVHFFVMELSDIKNNRFGYSDQESAGSAQAMLLKDEFYRSAILLAGKKPAYWLFQPDIQSSAYDKQLAKLKDANPTLFAQVLDMGNLEPIQKGEYFGASLWQIVKAMKSPFKSIMKIGLLDAYLSAHSPDHLLSNRLKHNIFQGMKDLWEIDPYALLFEKVFTYYRTAKRENTVDLVRLSFLQKTSLSFDSNKNVEEEYIPIEYFFPYSETDIAGYIEPRRGGEKLEIKHLKTFSELAEFGDRIVKFMLKTLLTIQKQLSQLDIDLPISQEDLTKLGRKITSALAPSDNKIMRLPFVDSTMHFFSSLEISCEGMPGSPKTWFARGDVPKSKDSKGTTALIRQDKKLERLLIWLIANNLYKQDTHIYASSVEFPLTLPDIAELLDFLVKLFPPHQVFQPDISQFLKEEEVIAACIIINLDSARDSKKHKTATIMYATNWGELYCLTNPKGINQLDDQPRKFLYANIGKRLRPNADLKVFIPKKCQCPRIVLV